MAKKTLVFFTSDNGPWLTKGKRGGSAGRLRGGKGGTYEGGVRVPALAWWPGRIPAGSVCDAVAGNIDLLPTFVKLAGGEVPAKPKIDGKDISPLLLGKSKKSPHRAYYLFKSNRLEAVRAGKWKLAFAPQSENRAARRKLPRPKKKGPFRPRLYDLDADVGETTDVSAKHPEVVKRLQGYVAAMNADLGAAGKGPGVRPPGRVDRPKPLLLN
jgi:arylsulfatase A-like enzyme